MTDLTHRYSISNVFQSVVRGHFVNSLFSQFCVSVKYLIEKLKGKIYLGSQFQRFCSTVSWFHYFVSKARLNITVTGPCWERGCSPHTAQTAERKGLRAKYNFQRHTPSALLPNISTTSQKYSTTSCRSSIQYISLWDTLHTETTTFFLSDNISVWQWSFFNYLL
jgi:hypothetical protein